MPSAMQSMARYVHNVMKSRGSPLSLDFNNTWGWAGVQWIRSYESWTVRQGYVKKGVVRVG